MQEGEAALLRLLRLSAMRRDVAVSPVVEAGAGLHAELAGRLLVLDDAAGARTVAEDGHQVALCDGMGIEAADVLLLAEAGHAAARAEQPFPGLVQDRQRVV